MYLDKVISIHRYIYIDIYDDDDDDDEYILRCILYGFLKLALPGVMNLS